MSFKSTPFSSLTYLQPVGGDAAAVWLAEDGVPRCALLPSPSLGPFGRVAARERQGALSRRAW